MHPLSLKSKDRLPVFKAHLKAISGELYLLEKFFFMSKQLTLIELSDIH